MTQAPRITLKIDRILCDGPAPDRAALEVALHQALAAHFGAGGAGGFGPSRNLAGGRAEVPAQGGPLAARLAQAVVGGVIGGQKGGAG